MAVENFSEPDRALIFQARGLISQTGTPNVHPAPHHSMHSESYYRFDAPFTDFAGRCFLRGCLFADLLESWIRKEQARADAKIDSASWRAHLHVMGWLRSSLGAASCTAVAGCLIPIFSGNTYRAIVPILFLAVILYIALRFGDVAGIIGTVCAALVFEIFLFEPTLSFAIGSSTARNHVISMVILGICASELLGRRKAPVVYKPW
ncbi:MAG: DUF4118 domain-containing protein [Terriglobales bacterium]